MNAYAEAAKLMAQVQKAGARHSSKDNSLIQQLHDLSCELGAECPMKDMAIHPQLKAAVAALVLRHPGHGNQKVHGNRFGTGQAKESLRRLKDDKGARERYKTEARKRGANDPKRMNKFQLQGEFGNAKTAGRRAEIANELFGRSGFADKTIAKTKEEIPKIDDLYPSAGKIGFGGKLAVFQEENGVFGIGPIVQNVEGEYITGTLGKVRRVKPEFVGGR